MTGDLADAVATLERYEPRDHDQRACRDRILAFCAAHDDALERTCAPGHLTASAVVVDSEGARALLHLHRKLGRWLQLGGHCDGDGDLAAVALREATEESGIAGLRVAPAVLDVDVHTIPERAPGQGAHLHLDVRFLVVAPPDAVPVTSAESLDVRWFTWKEAATVVDEDGLHALLARARDSVGASQE